MKQRLRPQRSVSLLHGIIRIAITSRKSVIVACTPVTVVFRSSVMSLIITFMFEPAKLQMNCASASGARKARRDATEDPAGVLTGVILARTRRGVPRPVWVMLGRPALGVVVAPGGQRTWIVAEPIARAAGEWPSVSGRARMV